MNLLDNILQFRYDPSSIQQVILDQLGAIEMVDATNPVALCMEAAVMTGSAAMIKNEISSRKQYPLLAQDEQDLYYHMSDRDYIGRFAMPSQAKISLLLLKDETINRMVMDTVAGYKKIVIPRNTMFKVAGCNFSLQYPIEIRQLAHGGLQVVWDPTVPSPLTELTTNFIDFEIRSNNIDDYIYFEVEAYQFEIVSIIDSITRSSQFRIAIPYNDDFLMARVYVEDDQGKWNEMAVTHSEQVYDPTTPTAVLKVAGKEVSVTIPQIYINMGYLSQQNIRCDVYQTKGPLNIALGEYPDNIVIDWLAIDSNDNTEFVAPIRTLPNVICYSSTNTTGGSSALTFDQLRSRVIANAVGAANLPITPAQIQNLLQQDGFDIIKNIDHITGRVFLASRQLPEPSNPKLITAAASSIETIVTTMAQLSSFGIVKNNGESMTICSNTLFQIVNGVISIVPDTVLRYLNSLSSSSRTTAVNAANYVYTPFHYVLDGTGNQFAVRPYYLDSPNIVTKLFVSENDSTLLQVGTKNFTVAPTQNGFVIDIVTNSGESFKQLNDDQVFVQMAYIPQYETTHAYLNGQLVGRDANGERVYRFTVSTNYNVDSNDNLELLPFSMFKTSSQNTFCPLQQDFDLVYSTTSAMPTTWTKGEVDNIVGNVLIPGKAIGISHEKLRVKFGDSLSNLWAQARSIAGGAVYKTYTTDQYLLYTEDVYQADPVTGATISIDANGNIVRNKLHSAGEPILDSNNNKIVVHRSGDTVVDPLTNLPIPLDPRTVVRQIDILMIEGSYFFATDLSAIGYRKDVAKNIVDWLTNKLASISRVLLEKTKLYFYPKTNMGNIEALVDNGIMKTISAAQSFTVHLYLSETNYNNAELKKKLEESVKLTLSQAIGADVITQDNLTEALKLQLGSDVLSVKLFGLGGTDELNIITLTDKSTRCGIRKVLVDLPDNSLIVQPAITVIPMRHNSN